MYVPCSSIFQNRILECSNLQSKIYIPFIVLSVSKCIFCQFWDLNTNYLEYWKCLDQHYLLDGSFVFITWKPHIFRLCIILLSRRIFCYESEFQKIFSIREEVDRESHNDIDIDRCVSNLKYLSVLYIIENFFLS